jgi:hypothetical protein
MSPQQIMMPDDQQPHTTPDLRKLQAPGHQVNKSICKRIRSCWNFIVRANRITKVPKDLSPAQSELCFRQ